MLYRDEQGVVQTRHQSVGAAKRHIASWLAVRYDGPFRIVSGFLP